MAVEKLGVIVPYRDRYEHLLKFKMLIQAKLHEAKIPYELIVVEQDDSQSFNRGKLLNIGILWNVEICLAHQIILNKTALL